MTTDESDQAGPVASAEPVERGESAGRDHGRAYRTRVLAERDRLRAALPAAAEHQRMVLDDLVDRNAGTAFGRRHGLAAVRTLDDLRAAVPVQTFADHAPWIERMAAGERRVLTARDPVVYFTSSGSTGERKKIPITADFMRTSFFPFFYAAWAPIVEHFPDTLARPEYFLNLKHDVVAAPTVTASGRPHLGASQVDFGAAFGEPLSAEPGTRAPWMRLPVAVDDADHERRMYLRLRMAVEADVRAVIGINPAMVAVLPHQLARWWPDIVREVRDGTLGGVRCLEPNPRRARELDALDTYAGTIRPAQVWPRMRVLFCWTTGIASLYLPGLRAEFGADVAVLPAPVAASEGPVAVALDRHGTAGSLLVTAAVHEFLDADDDVTPDSDTLRWEELEAGREYHVIFTHVGGFYRYAVGDVVRVVDRVAGVPRVEYAGRGTRSDAAGERLRESQVTRAVAAAARAGGLEVRNVACRVRTAGPAAYEFALASTSPWSPTEIEAAAARLDEALGAESPGYRTARAAGHLGPPTVRQLGTDAFARDWQARVAEGVRPTQVKDRMFRQDAAMWDRLVAEPFSEARRAPDATGQQEPAAAAVAALEP
ncbi:GH3 auxin-responsive promoter-binding protein [Frankia torreyi]|uniref:GH3 auxin-responsive promoter-binding protein n=2 Tax=Frankia TaxID=1854 RepID=A0A0D8BCE9_9ACTN|nr:GH3 auxin-responsive promoter family protein [Frankia torreyi]KJE21072.1 GH3 auxin-responsive promoter-binding protein [Frankia torreyi]